MKIFHFQGYCINRFLYSDLVCCHTDYCDFQEFLCTVTCIKYLVLPYLYNKPQRQLILNHIEGKCYHHYNPHLIMDDLCGVRQHVAHSSFSSKHAEPPPIGARKMDGLSGVSAADLLVILLLLYSSICMNLKPYAIYFCFIPL